VKEANRSVKAIPDGHHTATPYLILKGGTAALDFYKRAFGAEEICRCPMPDGRLGHAEIQIGDSRIMLADEFPEMGAKGPQTLGGTPVGICLYVQDVDSVFARAVSAGAKSLRPVQDQFYGDRSGTVTDPFGHQWTVATHVEDIPAAEIQRRMDEMASKMGGKQGKGCG
jgi:PhnB protein